MCGGHFSSMWSSMQPATPHTMKSSHRNELGRSIPTAPVLKPPSSKFPSLYLKTSEKCKSHKFLKDDTDCRLLVYEWRMNQCFFCSENDSCLTENIHKDFRKAIGANCIFYSASTQQLIVLVSDSKFFSNRSVMWSKSLSCLTVSLWFSSVHKWVHSEASRPSKRHALPEYSYQTHVDVPQWGGHQTLRGA